MMKGKALIGTGFYANAENYDNQLRFLELWLSNTKDQDIVIVDNSIRPLELQHDRVRIIRLNRNAGHVDQFLGKFRPQLLGMSLTWLVGALVAYTEERDFIYKEQDCLTFGPWMEEMNKRAELYKLVVQMGYAVSTPARVECCLFWVAHGYIIEFMAKYTGISEGDGLLTPEEKFDQVSRFDRRNVPLPFGVGRDRPLPFGDPIWYGQRFTAEEIGELRNRKLI